MRLRLQKKHRKHQLKRVFRRTAISTALMVSFLPYVCKAKEPETVKLTDPYTKQTFEAKTDAKQWGRAEYEVDKQEYTSVRFWAYATQNTDAKKAPSKNADNIDIIQRYEKLEIIGVTDKSPYWEAQYGNVQIFINKDDFTADYDAVEMLEQYDTDAIVASVEDMQWSTADETTGNANQRKADLDEIAKQKALAEEQQRQAEEQAKKEAEAKAAAEETAKQKAAQEAAQKQQEAQNSQQQPQQQQAQQDSNTSNSSWNGAVLSKSKGRVKGPSGYETYYNLNMAGVVRRLKSMGIQGDYWVRSDGVKMYGNYVMCAANLSQHPRGSIVKSSLGDAIVADTGGFAHNGSGTALDIATTW